MNQFKEMQEITVVLSSSIGGHVMLATKCLHGRVWSETERAVQIHSTVDSRDVKIWFPKRALIKRRETHEGLICTLAKWFTPDFGVQRIFDQIEHGVISS